MFTGIVQEVGTVNRLEKAGGLYRLEIGSAVVSGDARIGDSVAVNGACLTVTAKKKNILCFDAMAETIRKTDLGSLREKDAVNLEGSLKANDKLSGHFVLGHVDCIGTIRDVRKTGDDFLMEIYFPGEFADLVVAKGSISVDGVSLTVGETERDRLGVYLIPHTLKASTLGSKKRGSKVNLEFDIIGKYIAKSGALKSTGTITEGFLAEHGF